LTEPGGWSIGITGFGECLPNPENRVTLNKDKRDAYGLPTLNIDAAWGENEKTMRKDMKESAAEMLEAAGFKNVNIYDNPDNMGLVFMRWARQGWGRIPKRRC
jgi:choline dehydrogenase-like flavoprotein